MFDLHGYGPTILEGAAITAALAFTSLAVAIFLGLMAAAAKLSKSPVARGVASAYTTIIRGIPELVLMLIVFFGGQVLVNNLARNLGYDGYIDINPFVAGSMTLGFIYGAYLAETFRGAFMAVPAGMIEAGFAFGMSRLMVFLRIQIPQMMRHALPGLGNNWLVLMKATALVSVIGLHDMVYRAGAAAGATREPFIFYFFVALLYLAFTSVSVIALRRMEHRYSVGERRA